MFGKVVQKATSGKEEGKKKKKLFGSLPKIPSRAESFVAGIFVVLVAAGNM